MAQQIAIELKRISGNLGKIDPQGHIAAIGLLLLQTVKERDRAEARLLPVFKGFEVWQEVQRRHPGTTTCRPDQVSDVLDAVAALGRAEAGRHG
jgi:hypothetical protein